MFLNVSISKIYLSAVSKNGTLASLMYKSYVMTIEFDESSSSHGFVFRKKYVSSLLSSQLRVRGAYVDNSHTKLVFISGVGFF